MQRKVTEQIKNNTIRGAAEASTRPAQTAVAAYPESSYIPHNTWLIGENDSQVGQLLQSLAGFSPSIQKYMGMLNDKRVEQDAAQGAADAQQKKEKRADASVAYESAYYKLKAEGDATDHQRQWSQLVDQSDSMAPPEFAKAKQDLIGAMIKGDENPEYLLHIVPIIARQEAQANEAYTKKQLQIQDLNVKDNISKTINSAVDGIKPDDPEAGKKLSLTLQAHLERAKDLGYTTIQLQDFMVDYVGQLAENQGRPELMDAFKENWKNNSAYNSSLRPKIDDYIQKASASKARLFKANQEARDQGEKKWRTAFLNTVYTAVDQNYGNAKGMEQVRKAVSDAALGKNEYGFRISTEEYKDALKLIEVSQSSSGAPQYTNSAAHMKAMVMVSQGQSFTTIMENVGWGLNAEARKDLLSDCLKKTKEGSTGEGSRYKTFVTQTAADLEQGWKNVNVLTGEMHFQDGIERSLYGRNQFYTRLSALEQQRQKEGKEVNFSDILDVAQKAKKYTDDVFDHRKAQQIQTTDKTPNPQPTKPKTTATPNKVVPGNPAPGSSVTARLMSYGKKQ